MSNSSTLDPKIGIELEKLNTSCERINNLEIQLDELKKNQLDHKRDGEEEIKEISSKIKSAIELALPFYQARLHLRHLSRTIQADKSNYDKAKTNLSAAKEMVSLAEGSVTDNGQGCKLDYALQEMISHATTRVNQYTGELASVQNNLRVSEMKYDLANMRVTKLQSQLKSAIKVSRPYYEKLSNYNCKVKAHKMKIAELECQVLDAKATYNDALQNLERISDEIHQERANSKINNQEETDEDENEDKSNKNKTYLCYQNSLSDDYEVINGEEDSPEEGEEEEEEDFEKQSEKWSEIPLSAPISKSNSSASSSYSEQADCAAVASNENDKEANGEEEKKQSGSFSSWISKNSFRRSSLEDVFAQSFGKFGRSMERRNSESEVEVTTKSKDFFLFNKQELTDSQISLIFLTE